MEALGVAIAVGFLAAIIFYFKARKNRKAVESGHCPKCAGALQSKNINNEEVKICEKKCGYAGANTMWLETSMLGNILGAEKDKPQEEVDEKKLTQWLIYKELVQ